MAYQLSRRQYILSVAYGQAMIALLVVLNVFYPQYLSYTFIIFIIGMVVFTVITMKTQFKHLIGKEAGMIKEGRRLFKADSKEVMTLQSMDYELVNELKPMLKSSMFSFLSLIILFVWYPIYFNYARSVASSGGVDIVTKVIVFLVGYEAPYALMTLITRVSRGMVKEMIQVVSRYEVYDRGIVGTGISLKFPLSSEYRVKVNNKRKFVDIVMKRGKVEVKYRLYTRNLSRLVDIIKRYGGSINIEFER